MEAAMPFPTYMLNNTIYMIRPGQQMIKFQVGYTYWPAVGEINFDHYK